MAAENESTERAIAGLAGLAAHQRRARSLEELVFMPHWPEGLDQVRPYQLLCDDKGREGRTYAQVLIGPDGDAYLGTFEMEGLDDLPSAFPSIRVRTYAGGGRNSRTHQALLWLALAMKLDQAELEARGGPKPVPSPHPLQVAVRGLSLAIERLKLCLSSIRACRELHPQEHAVRADEIPAWLEELEPMLAQAKGDPWAWRRYHTDAAKG